MTARQHRCCPDYRPRTRSSFNGSLEVSSAPVVAMRAVCKRFSGDGQAVEVLRSVDLTVMSGEHVSIMGPSGSGKSTLLSILGCLDVPDVGTYRCFNRDVGSLSSTQLAAFRNQNIGFVFQNFSLLPRLTAQENVAMPLEYAGQDRASALRRALAVLEDVGLGDRATARPRQLSGGQQQRVAVARALVNNPRLILADEPTGALDRRSAAEINALLAGLKQIGRSVIVVTHDLEVASAADRVLPFVDGRLVQ